MNTQNPAQPTARTALALSTASTMMHTACTTGIIGRLASGNGNLTAALLQQFQSLELLRKLPQLLADVQNQLQQAAGSIPSESPAALVAATPDASAAAHEAMLGGVRVCFWAADAAVAMHGLTPVLVDAQLQPLLGCVQLPEHRAEIVRFSTACLQFIGTVQPWQQQHKEEGTQQRLGEKLHGLMVISIASLRMSQRGLLSPMQQAAADQDWLRLQLLRTAFLQCWCWLQVMSVLQTRMQDTGGSSGNDGSSDHSSIAAGAAPGAPKSIEVAPALQKLLQRLGCSRTLALRCAGHLAAEKFSLVLKQFEIFSDFDAIVEDCDPHSQAMSLVQRDQATVAAVQQQMN